MKNVVIIGGGTGLSLMLRGLKEIEDVELSAVVTVADDGGSTGRLREQYHIPAMGDIRSVMCALGEEETLLSDLMSFRFGGSLQDVGGHSLGNLLITALTEITGSFLEAVQQLSAVLNIKGTIIPSTAEHVTLWAEMEDGTLVQGESNIPKKRNRIKRVFYSTPTTATEMAVASIEKADLIVYGIGSLYTSILPNVIIPDICQALRHSSAEKVYFCNTMTQPGETSGYSLEDHIQALEDHSFIGAVNTVVTHSNSIPVHILERYKEMDSVPISCTSTTHTYRVFQEDLLTFQEGYIRHDSNKVKRVIENILKNS